MHYFHPHFLPPYRLCLRQNSLVMEEVCVLKGMKSVLESTHSRVNSLEDSLSDIAGGIGVSRSQIALLLEKVSAGAPVQSQVNLLTEIRNGLSANTALLTETLKVSSQLVLFNIPNFLLSQGSMTGSEVSCLGTIPGKAAYSAPLTPILTPKHTPIRKCSDCGSITHLRADCPDKLNFCSRYKLLKLSFSKHRLFLVVSPGPIRYTPVLLYMSHVVSARRQAVVILHSVTQGSTINWFKFNF